ncbi:MAG: hypothetical protein ACM33T_06160 [Solirubrobacterales bacterium]
MPENVKLQETGFPWLPLAAGVVALLAVVFGGMWLGLKLAGLSLVASLVAFAVFAALLGINRLRSK